MNLTFTSLFNSIVDTAGTGKTASGKPFYEESRKNSNNISELEFDSYLHVPFSTEITMRYMLTLGNIILQSEASYFISKPCLRCWVIHTKGKDGAKWDDGRVYELSKENLYHNYGRLIR